MWTLSTWAIILAAVLVPFASAQGPFNSFAGCYQAAGLPTGSDDISTAPVLSGTTSRADCQAYCIGQSTPAKTYYFSHLTTNSNGQFSTCSCSVRSILSTRRTNGNSNYACPTGAASSSYLQTAFNLVGCTNLVVPPGLTLAGLVQDTRQCFVLCGNAPNADWVRQITQPTGYNCYCGTINGQITPSTSCSAGTNQVYARSPEAAASGLTRRNRRLEIEARKRKKEYCPAGMSACLIQGQGEAYECIETDSELESCGGCVYGQFGEIRSKAGVDCTALPGINQHAVTCDRGQCRAFACEEGYYLQRGICASR